jgi:hypothetical protein
LLCGVVMKTKKKSSTLLGMLEDPSELEHVCVRASLQQWSRSRK